MVSDMSRLSQRADQLEHNLALLYRLTTEAGALLGSLGTNVGELATLTQPIHARASVLTVAQANIAATKAAVDELLDHLDTSRRVQGVLEGGPGRDVEGFLSALQQLEASNEFLQAHSGLAAVRSALSHSKSLSDAALRTCDADFRASLAAGAKGCAPSPAWVAQHCTERITENNRAALTLPLVPPALLPKLARMAALLLDAKHTEALEGYAAARSSTIEALLLSVCKEVPPLAALQALPSEQLDRVMADWASQLRALALLLLSERRLADALWRPPHNEALLVQAAAKHVAALAHAGRDAVKARNAPDKVFSLLDMHQQLAAALPALSLSLGNRSSTAVSELVALQGVVATAAAALFGAYESAVAGDASKVVVADATIHPLCAQVLSYVKRLLTYDNAATVLWGDSSQPGSSTGASKGSSSSTSSSSRAAMAVAVGRLLERLVDNLGLKARVYKSEAQGALFMMNNVHYMAWSVEGSTGPSGALELLGCDWVETSKDAVEDWGAKYHTATWMPLVRMLQAEVPCEPAALKAALKERFSRFNETLDRIATVQCGWTIPDPGLKAAVKRVVKADLLQPYQDFLQRHADVDFTQNPAKYIKYAAADVAAIIEDDLFESKTAAVGSSAKLSLRKEKLDSFH